MIQGVLLHLLGPTACLPASPNSYLSIIWIVLSIFCCERGDGVCKGHFWLVNGFLWHNICDVIDITQRSLGLFTKGRTQESALLDEWVWWVHSRAFGCGGVE